MSLHEIKVTNFIYLLEHRPDLFSDDDRYEISQRINSVNDDIKEISNAIVNWCANHPEAKDALKAINDTLERAPGTSKTNSNIPKYQLDKRTLLNAIQQSSATVNNDEKTDNNDDKSSSKS